MKLRKREEGRRGERRGEEKKKTERGKRKRRKKEDGSKEKKYRKIKTMFLYILTPYSHNIETLLNVLTNPIRLL